MTRLTRADLLPPPVKEEAPPVPATCEKRVQKVIKWLDRVGFSLCEATNDLDREWTPGRVWVVYIKDYCIGKECTTVGYCVVCPDPADDLFRFERDERVVKGRLMDCLRVATSEYLSRQIESVKSDLAWYQDSLGNVKEEL